MQQSILVDILEVFNSINISNDTFRPGKTSRDTIANNVIMRSNNSAVGILTLDLSAHFREFASGSLTLVAR
jgi:hypothetical protein